MKHLFIILPLLFACSSEPSQATIPEEPDAGPNTSKCLPVRVENCASLHNDRYCFYIPATCPDAG